MALYNLIDSYSEQEEAFIRTHNSEHNKHLSQKEILSIFKIKEMFNNRRFNDSIREIDILLTCKLNSFSFKKELLKYKAKALTENNNIQGAVSCYHELLVLDKNNIEYYFYLANLDLCFVDKIEYMDKAIEIDPYNFNLYRYKAYIIYQNLENQFQQSDYSFDDVVKLYDKSISLDCTVRNYALFARIETLIDNHGLSDEIEKQAYEIEAKYPIYPDVVSMKLSLLSKKKVNYDEIKNYYNSVIDRLSYSYQYGITMEYIEVLIEFKYLDDIEMLFEYAEAKYPIDEDFYIAKASYWLGVKNNIHEGICVLNTCIDKDNCSTDVYKRLLNYYYLAKDAENYERMLSEYEFLGTAEHQVSLALLKNDKLQVKEILPDFIAENPENLALISFYFLMCNSYEECIDYIESNVNINSIKSSYVLYNYECAKYFLKKPVNKVTLLSSIDKFDDGVEKAAVYLLVGENDSALKQMDRVPDISYDGYYEARDWPIFVKYQDSLLSKYYKLIDA